MYADPSSRFAARREILDLLSDDELGCVLEEEGGHLSFGEEYVDLAHLPQGVHCALASDALNLKDFIRRRAVSDQTWSKICSTLGRDVTREQQIPLEGLR